MIKVCFKDKSKTVNSFCCSCCLCCHEDVFEDPTMLTKTSKDKIPVPILSVVVMMVVYATIFLIVMTTTMMRM